MIRRGSSIPPSRYLSESLTWCARWGSWSQHDAAGGSPHQSAQRDSLDCDRDSDGDGLRRECCRDVHRPLGALQAHPLPRGNHGMHVVPPGGPPARQLDLVRGRECDAGERAQRHVQRCIIRAAAPLVVRHQQCRGERARGNCCLRFRIQRQLQLLQGDVEAGVAGVQVRPMDWRDREGGVEEGASETASPQVARAVPPREWRRACGVRGQARRGASDAGGWDDTLQRLSQGCKGRVQGCCELQAGAGDGGADVGVGFDWRPAAAAV